MNAPEHEKRNDAMREIADHKNRVAELLLEIVIKLLQRGIHHDDSKFNDDEFNPLAEVIAEFRKLPWGSPEYLKFIQDHKIGFQRHYDQNRHHPEFHDGTINNMNLIDILEMLADWKAATERHENGDLANSINAQLFDINPQLTTILHKTAQELGWTTKPMKIPSDCKVSMDEENLQQIITKSAINANVKPGLLNSLNAAPPNIDH